MSETTRPRTYGETDTAPGMQTIPGEVVASHELTQSGRELDIAMGNAPGDLSPEAKHMHDLRHATESMSEAVRQYASKIYRGYSEAMDISRRGVESAQAGMTERYTLSQSLTAKIEEVTVLLDLELYTAATLQFKKKCLVDMQAANDERIRELDGSIAGLEERKHSKLTILGGINNRRGRLQGELERGVVQAPDEDISPNTETRAEVSPATTEPEERVIKLQQRLAALNDAATTHGADVQSISRQIDDCRDEINDLQAHNAGLAREVSRTDDKVQYFVQDVAPKIKAVLTQLAVVDAFVRGEHEALQTTDETTRDALDVVLVAAQDDSEAKKMLATVEDIKLTFSSVALEEVPEAERAARKQRLLTPPRSNPHKPWELKFQRTKYPLMDVLKQTDPELYKYLFTLHGMLLGYQEYITTARGYGHIYSDIEDAFTSREQQLRDEILSQQTEFHDDAKGILQGLKRAGGALGVSIANQDQLDATTRRYDAQKSAAEQNRHANHTRHQTLVEQEEALEHIQAALKEELKTLSQQSAALEKECRDLYLSQRELDLDTADSDDDIRDRVLADESWRGAGYGSTVGLSFDSNAMRNMGYPQQAELKAQIERLIEDHEDRIATARSSVRQFSEQRVTLRTKIHEKDREIAAMVTEFTAYQRQVAQTIGNDMLVAQSEKDIATRWMQSKGIWEAFIAAGTPQTATEDTTETHAEQPTDTVFLQQDMPGYRYADSPDEGRKAGAKRLTDLLSGLRKGRK